MITKIELALIERLKLGLGKMVYSVGAYAGEFDDAQLAIRRSPAVLVSYGGAVLKPVAMGSRGQRFLNSSVFAVMVITRTLQNGVAGFHGSTWQIGANQLVEAVKYLLTNQTLGGLLDKPLKPRKIRTLWNNQQVLSEKLSAYSLEFEAEYYERPSLEDGKFPLGSTDENHPEYLFSHYQGKLDSDDPDLHRVSGVIFDPTNSAQVGMEINLQAQSQANLQGDE